MRIRDWSLTSFQQVSTVIWRQPATSGGTAEAMN
jgi:hypothetical protein